MGVSMSLSEASPDFSHLLVTKRWKGWWPDKARDRGPRKRTVGYVEEVDGGEHSQETDHSSVPQMKASADAVEGV